MQSLSRKSPNRTLGQVLFVVYVVFIVVVVVGADGGVYQKGNGLNKYLFRKAFRHFMKLALPKLVSNISLIGKISQIKEKFKFKKYFQYILYIIPEIE